MTETPTHDPELELARQYGALRGLEDGRRAALGLIQANAYLDAYHREIQAAGLCNCPGEEAPLADWERNLLADLAKAGRAAEANQDSDGEANDYTSPGRKCAAAGCPNPQTGWGVCDKHQDAPDGPDDKAADDAALQDTEADRDAEFKAAIDEADRRHRAAGFGRGLYLPVTGEADDLDQAGTKPLAHGELEPCGTCQDRGEVNGRPCAACTEAYVKDAPIALGAPIIPTWPSQPITS